MNNYQRQNCKGCIFEKSRKGGYCRMFLNEPKDHCTEVKFPPPVNGRPQRVPNPPTKPVA